MIEKNVKASNKTVIEEEAVILDVKGIEIYVTTNLDILTRLKK